MMKLMLTSAAILAFGGTAVQAQMPNTTAQSEMAMQGPAMTAEQKAIYAGLSADQKRSFDSWDLQQKGLYFALTTQQREQLWALPPAQQAQAWTQIRTAAGLSATAPTTGTSGSMNMPNNSTLPVRNGNGVDAAVKADYPVCSATITDSCINPRAAR